MTATPTIRDRITELRRVPASELIANPKNWRRHPKAQSDALRGVLEKVGYADALLARETPEGLVLIDGHLRAETTPDMVVPVLILDVNEEEADTILLTHDPLTAMAEADKDDLSALIDGLRFDDERLNVMIDGLARENKIQLVVEGATDPDEVPSDVPPKAKKGSLYILGEHRLLCGDATNEKDVTKLLAGEAPALMVTDPPYGVEYDPTWRKEAGVNKNPKKQGKVTNDDRADWSEAWLLFPGDVTYVWHDWLAIGLAQENLEAAGFEARNLIVWAKDRPVFSRGHYHVQHEVALYSVRKGALAAWKGERIQSTLWNIPARDDDGHGHGTQKPVECMERPIRNHDVAAVYDPFVGSGTTIIAAERQRRACFAMELEPRYVDVAVARWEAYTGQKAKKEKEKP
jgi:DNA modification methylase